MAKTLSNMAPLGMEAPPFNLPSTAGENVALNQFVGKPLLVAFICNHCPFVKHIQPFLKESSTTIQKMGVKIVAINSNDTLSHPDDSFEKMKEESYPFPYLFDASQEIARAYDAACTPDFYLFDTNHRLVYRGQLDDSRPGNEIPVTGKDLIAAVEALINRKPISALQKPSMGCNIKWKKGSE